jgi:predicted aspartyl protease
VGPAGTLDFFGLLDTGADETYLTRQLAERLGLEIQQQSECTLESASGEMSVSYAGVVIELSDGKDIHQWRTTVGITDQDWAEAILGHSGFLEYFDVLFRGKDREVEITRNKETLPFPIDKS